MSGGGTAGHITPLLAVARELQSTLATLHFIGQKGDSNAKLVEGQGIHIHSIRAGKYRRYHDETIWQKITDIKTVLLNAKDATRVVIGFFQAIALLIRIKPDVIFCKGGYVVVPVGYAARLLRIPYITHDSDMVPGLANRLIAKGAVAHAVVSSEISAYPQQKMVVTGIPVPDEYVQKRNISNAQAKISIGVPQDSILIFVYAGTQGAKRIDDAVRIVAPDLLRNEKKLYICHVFGRLNEDSATHVYENIDPSDTMRVKKLTFIQNAYDYIAAADIIIARAGATSCAEFSMIGRPVIIIPATQLTGGHQLENAAYYQSADAAEVILEDQLPDALKTSIEKLIASPKRRTELARNIQKLSRPQAAADIAALLLSVCERRHIS